MSTSTSFSVPVRSGASNWWRRIGMGLTLGMPLVVGALGQLRMDNFAGGLAFLAFFVGGWIWLLHSVDARASVSLFANAELEAHEDHFVVRADGKEQRYDKREVEHVFTFEKLGQNVIVRLAKGGELIIKAADKGEAQRLVAALKPDPGRHTARVPIAPIAYKSRRSRFWACAAFAASWLTSVAASSTLTGGGATWFAIGCLGMLLAAYPLLRRAAVVGTDGVRIDHLLSKRFIPHAELDATAIPTVALGGELDERIQQAQQARGRGDRSIAERLDRGDRSTEDWLEALKGLARSEYRQEPVRIADLEQLLEDAAVAPRQRIAAAIALSDDDDGKARVRFAAEASADESLRAALEAAAEGEIDERAIDNAERRFAARR
jgi:hypothetical protein